MKQFTRFFSKNKNLTIAAAATIVLVLVIGFFIIRSSNNSANQQVNSTPAPTSEAIPTINPSDLGITLTAGPGNKTVILAVAKTDDISSLDYELSYMATVNGSQIARGAIGHIDIKKKGTPVKQDITLGTCSDVCHYDTGVSDIKLTLKINKTDSKTYQADLTLNL